MSEQHYREALKVVLEALALPHAATVGNEKIRAEILNLRLMHTVCFLERVLDDEAPWTDIPWSVGYLRERLAENPPVGYVTHEQAREALDQGASWDEAVTPEGGWPA